ncbi:hypothetical protein GCM10010267_65890 [Streptomyces griseorubens]|nr:hypothetical protein GCM10010267_65890 [Streptomyces griseorubens]
MWRTRPVTVWKASSPQRRPHSLWKGTCTYAGGTPDPDGPPHPAPVPSNAALPASSRATGTRKGEQET